MSDNLKELATMAKLIEVLGQSTLLKLMESEDNIDFERDPMAPFTFVEGVLKDLKDRWKASPEFASMQAMPKLGKDN